MIKRKQDGFFGIWKKIKRGVSRVWNEARKLFVRSLGITRMIHQIKGVIMKATVKVLKQR